MSIATDEARKESHRRCLEACVAPAQFVFQNGYVVGRTAEPTEAETKAAITEWDRHGYYSRVGDPIVCMCGAKLTDGHGYDVHLVRAMLEAARKAVSE